MFKPCPNCGFLVALIAGREASQRCPRCGSAMLEDGELPPVDEAPARAARPRDGGTNDGGVPSLHERATRHDASGESGGSDESDVGEPTGAPADARPPTGARGLEDDAGSQTAGAPAATPTPAGVFSHAATANGDTYVRASTAASVPSDADASARVAAGVDADTRAGADLPGAAAGAAAGANMPDADADADADAPAAHAGADIAPSFTARRVRTLRPSRGRRWPWAVALPLLGLLLALQLLLSQRAELAQDATWRPLVTGACTLLGCDVPAWREPAAFAMLARNVRPHASRGGVLHVTTSLRNDAPWPQPLPVVVLSLSDVDGRVLAARAVPPSDYGRTAATLVDPGDSVDIAFDVREPSPRVVSFDFQLR